MPYKERIKQGKPRKRNKAQYKITNWSEYNKSLKNRGRISLYLPGMDIKSQFINDQPYTPGVSGQAITYKQPYIEFIYVMYRLCGWGIRQITGYIEDLWLSKGLVIKVPSFGHLSNLFATVSLEIKQYCKTIRKKIELGEDIDLIADSTGLRFGKASDWYQTKYNKPRAKKPWKKLHISMDQFFNIHTSTITECDVADINVLEELIPEELTVKTLIADGGYYSIEVVEQLYQSGIIPAIPPPVRATVDSLHPESWHSKIVQYIQNKGTVYAFYKKYNYTLRSLIEAQNSRIKRCIGNSLLTQTIASHQNEGIIIGNIINLWNSFGKCRSVKIG